MPPDALPDRKREGLGHRLSALWEYLTRPLWREPPVERARRWQRLALQGPIGIVVGASFGVLAGREWMADPFTLAVACGIGGFVAMYVLGQAESFLRLMPRKRRGVPPTVIRVGADVVGGGLMGWALASVMGTDAAASLLAGASILAGYSYVVSRLLWGNVLSDVVRVVSGNTARARGPDYSREKTLAARGQIDEALELYEQWCELRPGDPEPAMHAAWMLREARRYEDALAWYRRALDAPKLDGGRAATMVRHIWEIAVTKLDDPALALPDLERLLEEHPVTGRKGWVLREIEELGGRLPPGSEAEESVDRR